jgi:predicted secreted hydrolase
MASLCLGLLAALPAADVWKRITAPPALSFPRDHGAHLDVRTEWWYFTGQVRDDADRVIGAQLTFFRLGIEPPPPVPDEPALVARHVLAAHLAIADVPGGRLRVVQRLRRLDGLLAGASTDDLALFLDDWEVRRDSDGRVLIGANGDGVRIALRAEPVKRLVVFGERGLSAKGPESGNASAYLSWTRLAVGGEISLDGRRRKVRGAGWFDHEWGTSQLGAEVVGWDWFGLQLADGRDVMLYRLRTAAGAATAQSSGAIVLQDGSVQVLPGQSWSIDASGRWRSPRSGGVYPAGWRLRVPVAGIDVNVVPRFPDSELDGRVTTGVVYWEGPVAVSGSASGEGYAELTGYAGSLAGLL